jgi:hypothetical protein
MPAAEEMHQTIGSDGFRAKGSGSIQLGALPVKQAVETGQGIVVESFSGAQ